MIGKSIFIYIHFYLWFFLKCIYKYRVLQTTVVREIHGSLLILPIFLKMATCLTQGPTCLSICWMFHLTCHENPSLKEWTMNASWNCFLASFYRVLNKLDNIHPIGLIILQKVVNAYYWLSLPFYSFVEFVVQLTMTPAIDNIVHSFLVWYLK